MINIETESQKKRITMIMSHPSEDSPEPAQQSGAPAEGTPIPTKKEVEDTDAYHNDDIPSDTKEETAAPSDPSAEKPEEEVERY